MMRSKRHPAGVADATTTTVCPLHRTVASITMGVDGLKDSF